jgi:hypothetical protein
MSASKPTPGPWARSKQATRSGGYTLPQPSILGLDGAVVVAWPGFDGLDLPKEETAANIKLICAAPDLAAALLGLEYGNEPGAFCDHAAAPCSRCDAAFAALQKAGLR